MVTATVYKDKLDDNIMIKCGDSDKIMKKMPDNSVDLFLTDPPYKDYQSNRAKVKTTKISAKEFCPNRLVNHISRILKPGCHFYIFCDHLTFSSFFTAISSCKELHYKNMIVWPKNNHGSGDLQGNYAPQHELIIFGVKGKGHKLNYRPSNVLYKKGDNGIEFIKKVPNNEYDHSTIKPVEILEILINTSSNIGDLVFDPYAGSFSTAHASINTGRASFSIELDKTHYTNGKKRLRKI